MNEARVINFALIGIFILMLCAYIFTVQISTDMVGFDEFTTTVSAFCG